MAGQSAEYRQVFNRKRAAGAARQEEEVEGLVERRHATGLFVGEQVVLEGRVLLLFLGLLLLDDLGDGDGDDVGQLGSGEPKAGADHAVRGGCGRSGEKESWKVGWSGRGRVPRGFPVCLDDGEASRDNVEGLLNEEQRALDAERRGRVCDAADGRNADWDDTTAAVGGGSSGGGGGRRRGGPDGIGGGVRHVDNSERNRRATPRNLPRLAQQARDREVLSALVEHAGAPRPRLIRQAGACYAARACRCRRRRRRRRRQDFRDLPTAIKGPQEHLPLGRGVPPGSAPPQPVHTLPASHQPSPLIGPRSSRPTITTISFHT